MDDKQEDIDKINEILNRLYDTVTNGDMGNFKDLLSAMHAVENKELLRTCYCDSEIEIIPLLCKYHRKKHLSYLLYEAHILHYLMSDNDNIEMKTKEDSFFFAMCSNRFEILEMLYDYWSGDLHWLGHKKEYDKFDVENLNQLNVLLKCAFGRYQDYIQIKRKINPQNILNIESLLAFSIFQIELYSKLNDLKTSLITWEEEPEDIVRIQETYAIKAMILAVFDIYEKHSEQNLTDNSILEISKKTNIDSISLLYETKVFLYHEVFFRKLDYNFCLLILDNLHLLKLRLSMPQYSYQKIENKLYYFIYQISKKWSLYLPKRNKIETVNALGPFKGKLCKYSVNYDRNVFNIIFLERRDFKVAMEHFKHELQNRNIEENLRKSQTKLPNEDNNSLMLLPHLRDDYSLKRISQHIAQLHSINFKYEKKYAFLFIERTLQIVGEFLKSTNESLHLRQSTEALVKAEISVEVVNDLKTLRNLLCHAKGAELLKRIEVEVNNAHIFDLILKELLYVKKKIDHVIGIYKPIVERDLIGNALVILGKRRDEMPEIIAKVHYSIVDSITQIPNDFIRHIVEDKYFTNTWERLGFSKSLMEEVSMLSLHTTKLLSKLIIAKKYIYNNVRLKFPFYKEKIKKSLNIILGHVERWKQIIGNFKEKTPSVTFLNYPNEEDVNRIKLCNKKLVSGDDFHIQSEEVNELFANVEHHWKLIENLLQFIIQETRVFNDTVEELKWSLYTDKLKEITRYNYKDKDMEKNVLKYLDMIESKLGSIIVKIKINPPEESNSGNSEKPKFAGIKEFTFKLMTANMLTQEEKNILVNGLKNANIENNSKKKSFIQLMINKIKTDVAIPKKEYTKITGLVKLENKLQKILMNLVMGHKRNPMLPQCLKNRVCHLKEIMKQQPLNQLVLRYKLDKTFRVLMEILLFDIFIILECNKNHPSVKKSNKLLTEINLRNILTHGSPILEVVGGVLDADDLPTELVTKAYDFVNDEKAIDALCKLDELDFDFTQINNTQDSQYELLLKEFKTSWRWKDYLKLHPEYKQNMYEKQKKIKEKKEKVTDNNSLELLKALNKKDIMSVQDWIEKGANVNYIDCHKKAVIHYAAMKGSVNVLDVLLKNGADVNILNKENKLTALHYSAMNNFIDSVIFLLRNGANCYALDDKGRTPVYWANQRNHVHVCKVLIKAMKLSNSV